MKYKKTHNFEFLKSFSYFTPGPSGIGKLVIWFIVGVLLGNAVSLVAGLFAGEYSMDVTMMVAYPMMFLPPMIYASLASKKNSFFESGFALDSAHFGTHNFFTAALIVIVGTFAFSFVIDFVATKLPEPPQWLVDMMKQMTGGNIVIDFITVSLFAPFFEEWLCRGMVLRGLLNYKRKDGSSGINPAVAIILSALFFALIHGNIWQGLVAFLAGCLFGYVYYKTGSLKLTMLMHFTNNTISLILSNIPKFEDAGSWLDIIPQSNLYWIIYLSCFLILLLTIREFHKIGLEGSNGNCDAVNVE